MAKTRMLKHDLRTSEKVASWPIPVRYFWTLLWGYVDDHGKGKDNPLLVKADCFPLDPDVTAETIDEWLWHLEDQGVVVRYKVENVDYLAVIHWKEHQKPPHPTADVLPAFDDPRAVRRAVHASRMNGAGENSAALTPGLNGVGSVFEVGSGIESSPAAMESAPLNLSSLFEEAWQHWPKKVERKDAFEQFKRAAKRIDALELVAAISRFGDAYAATTDRQFVPALGVWLKRDRWGDDLPVPQSQGRRPSAAQKAASLVGTFRDPDAWMQPPDQLAQFGQEEPWT